MNGLAALLHGAVRDLGELLILVGLPCINCDFACRIVVDAPAILFGQERSSQTWMRLSQQLSPNFGAARFDFVLGNTLIPHIYLEEQISMGVGVGRY